MRGGPMMICLYTEVSDDPNTAVPNKKGIEFEINYND